MAQTLVSCVSLGKLLNFSETHFPDLSIIYLKEVQEELNEGMTVDPEKMAAASAVVVVRKSVTMKMVNIW